MYRFPRKFVFEDYSDDYSEEFAEIPKINKKIHKDMIHSVEDK